MREKIWYEMVHIKYGGNYLAYYINKKRTIRKYFKIAILIFSTGGVLGWKIWQGFPVVACVLIAIMQLIGLIENQIILSDNDIEKFSELRNKYVSYFNRLEKLWTDFHSSSITEEEANGRFYKLRKIGEEIEALDNKLHIQTIKALNAKAEIETNNYINQYHYKI